MYKTTIKYLLLTTIFSTQLSLNAFAMERDDEDHKKNKALTWKKIREIEKRINYLNSEYKKKEDLSELRRIDYELSELAEKKENLIYGVSPLTSEDEEELPFTPLNVVPQVEQQKIQPAIQTTRWDPEDPLFQPFDHTPQDTKKEVNDYYKRAYGNDHKGADDSYSSD